MIKDIIQVTLTGTTNKIRKMKVPSSFLQSSLVPILPEPIKVKDLSGKKLVPGQHHITVVRMFGCFFFLGGGCYFVVAEKQ